MHRYIVHTLTTLGLLLVLACLPAAGQTTRRSAAATGGWTFDVAPYLWLPALDGDITVHGRTAPVDVSIGEFVETIFESFQFAGIGRVEARRSPLVLTFDLSYLSLEEEDTTSLGINTEIDFSQLIVEFGAGYQLGEWPLGRRPWPRLSAEVLSGGRYVHLNSGLGLLVWAHWESGWMSTGLSTGSTHLSGHGSSWLFPSHWHSSYEVTQVVLAWMLI